MHRKLSIAVVLSVVLLLAGAVGAYAWDASRSDEIAEGVKIGGVDVGGLSEAEARQRVEAELVAPLARKLVVTHDDVRYELAARKLGIRADIEGTVDQAIEASREGGLPARVWRYATGGEVSEALDPKVSYDKSEVAAFVERVAAEVDRDPVNASVEPTSTSVEPVKAQAGIKLERDELQRQLTAAVQTPGARKVKATAVKVKPEVTLKELADQYPLYITVDRSSFKLKLWENLKLAKTYTVAIGAVGFETPTGQYAIQNKAVDPVWSVPDREWAGELAGTTVPGGVAENPLKARWLGIYDGAGIHGTDATGSLGSAASHGCVRMAISDVVELYDQVPVGTPIYIG